MLEKNNYPNPMKVRKDTVVLDGEWDFGYDGKKWEKILVPFCPESKLSGIQNTDFIPVCYYKKTIPVRLSERRTVLHFGAVDYRVEVFVNGRYVGTHIGGYTPFSFDITNYLDGETAEVSLTVRDDEIGVAARGKQSFERKSFGCFYTRVTGIWQSVWLEYVPEKSVKEFYFYPDPENCLVKTDLVVEGSGKYEIEVFLDGESVGKADGEIGWRKNVFIPLTKKRLWTVGEGNLYDVRIRFEQDEVESCFGLRSVGYDGYDFLLNGKKVFQKFVLDQGYTPDGLYSYKDVSEIERDIRLATSLGFNGARLHQKVFDPKYLYLCDKAGYMVWGEFPSWGIDFSDTASVGQIISEWRDVITCAFNHPSIVTWCPLNEVWEAWGHKGKFPELKYIESLYSFTKIIDTTRPCIDVSGGYHTATTDVYDFHCYETAKKLGNYIESLEKNCTLDDVALLYGGEEKISYADGLPVVLSEFGGVSFGHGDNDRAKSWGYGKGVANGAEFVEQFKTFLNEISRSKKISGFCYTQLYDIEQEQNGLYTYDRKDKLTQEEKSEIKKAMDSFLSCGFSKSL